MHVEVPRQLRCLIIAVAKMFEALLVLAMVFGAILTLMVQCVANSLGTKSIGSSSQTSKQDIGKMKKSDDIDQEEKHKDKEAKQNFVGLPDEAYLSSSGLLHRSMRCSNMKHCQPVQFCSKCFNIK